jgi:hypothetical protein
MIGMITYVLALSDFVKGDRAVTLHGFHNGAGANGVILGSI